VGAGDVGGVVGGQEGDRGAGFPRRADALERDAVVGDGPGAFGVGLGELNSVTAASTARSTSDGTPTSPGQPISLKPRLAIGGTT
jgi:hypothetical protein